MQVLKPVLYVWNRQLERMQIIHSIGKQTNSGQGVWVYTRDIGQAFIEPAGLGGGFTVCHENLYVTISNNPFGYRSFVRMAPEGGFSGMYVCAANLYRPRQSDCQLVWVGDYDHVWCEE